MFKKVLVVLIVLVIVTSYSTLKVADKAIVPERIVIEAPKLIKKNKREKR